MDQGRKVLAYDMTNGVTYIGEEVREGILERWIKEKTGETTSPFSLAVLYVAALSNKRDSPGQIELNIVQFTAKYNLTPFVEEKRHKIEQKQRSVD
ncbi:hypothetical protein HYW76_01255 [Candidatus Pacearchaeota archaeon]|nr:hypothetical protein [Candidatus Pacearchaeota archaeon]